MCSYVTEIAEVSGSAKGPNGWFRLSHTNVSFDHPYHSPYEHTLNIDFVDVKAGPSQRVAVELTAESAKALMAAIQVALDSAPHLVG